MMASSRMRSAAEHRLLSLEERQESVSGQLKLDDYVYDSFVVGIQIYINLVLRNYGPDFALLRTLKRKLMGLLYKHEELSVSKSHRSVWIIPLWILFMGGMVALNAEETTSFAQFIAKTMRQSALQGWPEVEKSLTQVLWTKYLQRSAFRALWNEVEGLMNDGNYQNNRDYYLMSYNTAPKIDPTACQGLVPAQSLVTLSDRIEGYDNGIFGSFCWGYSAIIKIKSSKMIAALTRRTIESS